MKTKESAGGLPFTNSMGDGFELMKKMWGMAGLPGMPNAGDLATRTLRLPQQLPSMVAPTFDIDELDKRIADLRAVEQWLELNVSMLRTAIQTLEVQRATITTLKGISGAMLSPLTKPTPKGDASAALPPTLAIPPVAPPANSAPSAHTARKSARRKTKQATPPPSTVIDAPLSPTAWWNTLQDQFSKIAATAAASASAPPQKPAKAKRRRGKSTTS